MTQHPAREVGQRWRIEVLSGFEPNRTSTLLERLSDGWRTDDPGPTESFKLVDTCWTSPDAFVPTLLSPSASPASGPPGDYEPCPEGCGRWKSNGNYRCWECHFKTYSRLRCMEAYVARTPDWTPPLESKPAETVVLSGARNPANNGTFLVVDKVVTPMPPAQAKPAETGCLDKCGDCSVCKPVQEAPRAEQRAIDGFWYSNDEGQRIGPFASAYARDAASRAYSSWMAAQSGTPYAGPERPPVRPMSFQPFDDDFAEDVR